MNRIAPLLLALVLLLAPSLAALPDDTTPLQTVWAALLCALTLAAALAPARKATTSSEPLSSAPEGVSSWSARPFRAGTNAATAFALFLALALCSLLARLLTQHSIAYLGQMLRGWGVLATEFALFALCRSLARAGRGPLYLLTGAAVLGAALISSLGVREYLLHLVTHEGGGRVFATSTPDFLAGYLVLLLPVTLALFLGAPGDKRLPLLFGLVIVLQIVTLLTTGSRFALVSLAVAFVTFGVTLAYAARHGLALDAVLRRRLAGIAVVVALAGLAAGGLVLRRLYSTSEGNSGAFRVWTWRGAARMAVANPVLGAGVGTWVDTYPRYALTGFTRLAHNSYLQLADECGIPALLVFVVTLGFVGAAGVRGLKTPLAAGGLGPPPPRRGDPVGRHSSTGRPSSATALAAAPVTGPLAAVAPTDDRLLLCGLLASLAAGVVQNLIDSDWYVFFIGVTFWALAGLVVGMSERTAISQATIPTPHPWLLPARVVAGLLLVLFITQGVAAWFGSQARTADDAGAARDSYQAAQAWDPLSARYPAELGARVLAGLTDWTGAESALRHAIRLEPNGTNFRRLGAILDAAKQHDRAAVAYQDGLRVDPNSLDLLLALAPDSPPGHALGIYRRITVLEDSPVGQVRAIGEITEARFAYGDAALAAADPAQAVHYGQRAKKLIEAYIDESGTLNQERQVQTGSKPDPEGDSRIQDLYTQVMTNLTAASPADQRAALAARAADYGTRLQAITAIAQGDTARSADEAATDYGHAADTLEGWITGAQSASADSQSGAQMGSLYKRALDSLLAVTPTRQQAPLQDRERAGLAKFRARFPTP